VILPLSRGGRAEGADEGISRAIQDSTTASEGRIAMVVGVMRLTLFLPENHSLKGKRQVLRAIKSRVQNKFNVSIAESDNNDMWQRAELGIAQVGNDRAFVDKALREVVNFIDSLGMAPLGDEQLEIINY
jgi:uncharacterized protein YlxP (DUF503 family)